MPSAHEVYSQKTIIQIEERAINLDALAAGIIKAVKNGDEVLNGEDVLRQIAEAAQYCQQALEFYDEEDAMPQEVAEAMAGLQGSICDLATAFLAWVKSNAVLP